MSRTGRIPPSRVRSVGPRPPASADPNAATFVGSLELNDVDLRHPQHRLHGSLGTGPIRTGEERGHPARENLPGQAEAILQPATHARLAAVRRERCPETIDLGLV